MVFDSSPHFSPSAIDRWPVPPDLRTRRMTPEWMDDPRLEPREHRRALVGLSRLNAVSRAPHHLWPIVHSELRRCTHRPLRVLDVACGNGDVLRRIMRWGNGRIVATGVDISPEAISEASRPSMEGLDFRRMDVLDKATPLPRADVVICSLFLHHLTDEQVLALLSRMARAARRRIVVSDLERSRTGWLMVWLASRVLTRSPVVHHDSARSVEAAWRPGELESLARMAGMCQTRVVRALPCRLIMTARPSKATKDSVDKGRSR